MMNNQTETQESKPIRTSAAKVFGTSSSTVVTKCQTCHSDQLQSVLFVGYLPPVNTMRPIAATPHEESSYPAELLHCRHCDLVQLGLVVDAKILFPKEYPYTSGTTKVLRENFAELSQEVRELIGLQPQDLVVDIGSNDGTLLSNFQTHAEVQGITPEDVGKLAIQKGIPTLQAYFGEEAVARILQERGQAKIITATNVFAHIEDVHSVLRELTKLLKEDGVFVSESHYWMPLLKTLQYDTVYHEHLRYYSLKSLKYLLAMHGLEVFHAKEIPTHGGSIRVYAGKKGSRKILESVNEILKTENEFFADSENKFAEFRKRVSHSKLALLALLHPIKEAGKKIYALGAPSRASTLVHYCGLDHEILDCVLEVPGSYKVGKYMPGTLIPVLDESKLFKDQPDYALILSWHIADEIAVKLRQKGFQGKFIVPLPEPRIID